MYSRIITLTTGNKVLIRSWINKESRADIIIIHGFLEHSGRYDKEANFFMDCGLSVFAYDQRGHGLSEGRRSYIKDFDFLVNDLKEVIKDTGVGRERPYYFFTHSMGGLVLLSHLLNQNKKDPLLKGMILSAPFLMPDPDLAPFLQKIAGFLGTFFPLLRTVGADPKLISRDPEQVQKYIDDPHVDLKPSYARSGQQILKQMKTLRPLYKNLDYPFLLMHGTDDKLSAIQGSEMLYENSQSNDKSFEKLEGFKHEITRELESEKVFSLMKAWLQTHP